MAAGVHVPLRFLRAAMKKGLSVLKFRFSAAQQTTKILEPVYAKLPYSNTHQAFRQKIGGRWYSTSIKSFPAPKIFVQFASKGPSVRAALSRDTAVSPFSSTLRPSLTGGAFPRTASGYSIGGGIRFFSHSPAAPAQVIQQVACAMRALLHTGKGQFDSYRYRDTMSCVSVRAQLASTLAQQNAPGAYVDFDLSPTLTCLSPINGALNSLQNSDFLGSLSADFGAMIGALVAINADIKRLSELGDLPISLAGRDVLRVHFRGCDRDFVERLCDEFGVRHGVVHEDERFKFGTLSPDIGWKEMLGGSTSPPLSSTYSEDGFEDEIESTSDIDLETICSRITGTESVGGSYYFEPPGHSVESNNPGHHSRVSTDFDGIQGIHRFLEECDENRSRLGAWR